MVREHIARALSSFRKALDEVLDAAELLEANGGDDSLSGLTGGQIVNVLIHVLQDDDPMVRINMARLLAQLKSETAQERLKAILHNGEPGAAEIRQALAEREQAARGGAVPAKAAR